MGVAYLSESVWAHLRRPSDLSIVLVVGDAACFIAAMWILFVPLPRLERDHPDGATATPRMQRLASWATVIGMAFPGALRLWLEAVAFFSR
jgi:hypothetical protein